MDREYDRHQSNESRPQCIKKAFKTLSKTEFLALPANTFVIEYVCM